MEELRKGARAIKKILEKSKTLEDLAQMASTEQLKIEQINPKTIWIWYYSKGRLLLDVLISDEKKKATITITGDYDLPAEYTPFFNNGSITMQKRVYESDYFIMVREGLAKLIDDSSPPKKEEMPV